ncbi:MAG TPA: BatD family protein [Polyangiaceae bacterium]
MKSLTRMMKACLVGLTMLPVATAAVTAGAATPQPPTAMAPAKSGPSVRAFAQVSLPKRTLYVGESVPITVQAYYLAGTGVTITGVPASNAVDFTLSLGDAAQGRATIGDDSYLVVTWKGHLSPAKAGRYALRMKVPSSLEWRAVQRRSAPTPDAEDGIASFFDSLGRSDQDGDLFAQMQQRMQRMMSQSFQDFDLGSVQKKDVVVESTGVDLDVEPLPAAGRPPAFSGAVGRFALEATVDSAHVRAGEPVDLHLVVRGHGNFDRVTTPGIPESAELKTYSPTTTEAEGAKTFEQAVVPQRPGAMEIPSVELAYFDPDLGRYATTRSVAIPLDVGPAQALASTHAGVVPDTVSGPPLAPNVDLDGKAVASLRPAYTHRGFWLAQLAPLGALAAAASLVVRRRRISADPRHAMRRRARHALRKLGAAMDSAVAMGDGPVFFAAARGALQQRLGASWGIAPEAITLVEIERRVKGPQLDTLRTIFNADAARFGFGAPAGDLARCRDEVGRILAHPEAS